MLFLLKTQCIMLYNILFQFIFGKTEIQNMFKHISDSANVKYSGEVDKINPNVLLLLLLLLNILNEYI